MTPELMAQIVLAFQPDAGVRIENLNPDEELAQRGRAIEGIFTAGVHLLKTAVPNARIQSLGGAIWDVFHHRHVVVAMGPPVPSLSFVAMGPRDRLQALVLTPHDWGTTAPADPVTQLGAIVLVGSQAVDFYNGRFQSEGPQLVTRRSRAYEAEFLRGFEATIPMNDYQQKVLQEHHFFDPALDYPRKAVEPKN